MGGLRTMAVPAAADGRNSIPPDGDQGPGSVIDTATAVLDGQGSVLLWSAGARRLLGYAAGDVTGRPAAMLLASDLPASARRCLAEQRAWNGRVSLRHMDGSRLDLELLAHPEPRQRRQPPLDSGDFHRTPARCRNASCAAR